MTSQYFAGTSRQLIACNKRTYRLTQACEKARDMTAETPKITALTPAQAVKILAAAGNRRITEAMIRADIDAGAPTNPRDADPESPVTINLVHYVAWLVQEVADGPRND